MTHSEFVKILSADFTSALSPLVWQTRSFVWQRHSTGGGCPSAGQGDLLETPLGITGLTLEMQEGKSWGLLSAQSESQRFCVGHGRAGCCGELAAAGRALLDTR